MKERVLVGDAPGGIDPVKGPGAPRLAWSLAGASTILGTLALVLVVVNGTTLRFMLFEEPPVGALLALTFPIVGAVIASRRPDNPLGWIFCAIGLSQGIVELTYQYAQRALIFEPGSLPAGAFAAWLSAWSWMPGFGLLMTFQFLLFPDGHLPSARWRYLGRVAALAISAQVVFATIVLWPHRGPLLLSDVQDELPSIGWILAIEEGAFLVVVASSALCVLSLVFRYRRARGDERKQLRWFTYIAVVVVVLVFPAEIVVGWVPSLEAASSLILFLLAPCLPIAIGVAILKYRLYDIDRIINRTLVYAAVSVLLALVYLAGVVLVGGIVRDVTNQETNNLVVAASTLAVAALFRPMRDRTQTFIDRRFYRHRYDAARTLEAFAGRLRDEVDLEVLTDDLIGVVRTTVRPDNVSLWLKPQTLDRPRV